MDNMRTWWPQHLLLGWMNLVLTAPAIYLFVGLSLVMRQHEFTGTQIGVLQLAGLPAMLKFVLATPIDRWHLGRSNYRHWALVLSLGYAASLWLLALNPMGDTPYFLLFALIMLVSLFATWADVPVNALAIALLPESERIRAGAVRSAATSLGSIVGGGLMLVLHTRLGWAVPLLALALGMLSCAVLVPLLKTPAGVQVLPIAPPKVGIKQWLGWFSTPQHRLWTVLLLLYYPLLGAVWVYLKPLMLDAGFAPERIALIVGVLGGLVAAIASMAGSRIARRIGAHQALPLFALCDLLVLAALSGAVILGLGTNALIAAALLVALMMGASAGLVYGLMMHHTRNGLSALDYGIQSSLFVIGRTVIPMLAGVVLDWGGYGAMLGSLMLGLALVLLLVCLSGPRVLTMTSHSRITS